MSKVVAHEQRLFIRTKVGRHVKHVSDPEQVAQLAGHAVQVGVVR
jgi:hypothetical protein